MSDRYGAPRAAAGDGQTMDLEGMLRLKDMHMAPYIQLATALIGKRRISGGNMFRHQIDTFGILLDYGFIDSILLKASVIHDLIEDVPEFPRDRILTIDDESDEVLKLVLEVTRSPLETKHEFLQRILTYGSSRAKLLKCADRISNVISLGYVTDLAFVKRYVEETERDIFPIALVSDRRMHAELQELVATRRSFIDRVYEI